MRSAILLLAVVLLFDAPIPAEEKEELEVRIAEPRNLATAIGSTPVKLVVSPAATKVLRIQVHVDGRLLATLTAPPWELDWEAGDGSVGHRLEALLLTQDGRTAHAAVRTSPLVVNEVEQVDLVDLYLVARDRQGRYVTGLGRDDFRVLENKKLQTIDRFSTSHKPLRVGIVLDTSWSMRGDKLEKAKRAALQFLDILEPGDEGLVVTFSDSVVVAQELSKERALLAAAIEGTLARGGTALYDAVWRTSKMLEGFDGRRVLVLLSDGRDEAANGTEPGSLHTLEEAVDQSLRSEVMLFAIGLGDNLRKEYIRRWSLSGLSNIDPQVSVLDVLEQMADSTGGRTVLAAGAGRLGSAFDDIAADLRNQYSIAYISTDPTADGSWRTIDVLTPGRDLEVVTRKGYYAHRPSPRSAAALRPRRSLPVERPKAAPKTEPFEERLLLLGVGAGFEQALPFQKRGLVGHGEAVEQESVGQPAGAEPDGARQIEHEDSTLPVDDHVLAAAQI